MIRRPSRPSRAGFTLIELLVVTGIIIVLVSLTAAAVQRVRVAADRAADRADISKLGDAIGAFKEKMKVDYIPSRLKLCERWSDYGNSQLDTDSQDWLRDCFRQMQSQVDWNANGTIDGPVILEGQEVLVFALGGIRGTQGFSNNSKNPAEPATPGEPRKGPFAEFKVSRLVTLPTPGGQAGYPAYLNVWGRQAKPYAYFSNYGKPNGYNRYGSSDCASLGVSPYQASSGKYWNENSFQIISAGQDGVFGPGGIWPPALGAAQDDMANFARGLLQAGPDN
jgi:hypothetical protein